MAPRFRLRYKLFTKGGSEKRFGATVAWCDQHKCEDHGFPFGKEMLQTILMKTLQNEEAPLASRQESTLLVTRPDLTNKQEEDKEIQSDTDNSCSFETIIGQNEVNPHLAI